MNIYDICLAQATILRVTGSSECFWAADMIGAAKHCQMPAPRFFGLGMSGVKFWRLPFYIIYTIYNQNTCMIMYTNKIGTKWRKYHYRCDTSKTDYIRQYWNMWNSTLILQCLPPVRMSGTLFSRPCNIHSWLESLQVTPSIINYYLPVIEHGNGKYTISYYL